MDIRHLARIDLNLLITLHVMLEEGSVSLTADRLYLTQPAISKSLSRLREIFSDPLFTRSGRGLVATPFAERLREPLHDLLMGVESLFVTEAFDPATYQANFAFAVNEFLDMALMPMLVQDLSKAAPGIHIETYTQMENQLDALEKGNLDFVLNLRFSEIPAGFHVDLLMADKPEIFARKGHPLFKKSRLSIADVFKYPRVALNMPDIEQLSIFRTGGSAIRQNQWKSPFETENLITALSIISKTDYLLPGPGLLQHFSSRELVFKALPLSAGSGISIEYCLVSHERVANSEPHQWLRGKIRDLSARIKL